MATTAAFRRLLLQGILWDSQDKGLTLIDALKSACRAKLTTTASGDFLVGTAGNGKTVQFEMPAAGRGCSPQEIAEETQRLYDLHAVAKAALIAGGVATPTDTQISTEMKFRLRPVTSFTLDHSRSRIGPCATEEDIALA